MYYEVIPASPGVKTAFTYAFDEKLAAGTVVLIPVKNKTVPGIVLRAVEEPEFKTKAILKVLYERPLPSHLLKSLLWLAEYYVADIGTCVKLFLPVGVEKKRRAGKEEGEVVNDATESGQILINSAQRRALEEIKTATATTKLLHGITGSGKTNIYLELAQGTLRGGKSVVLLVPEIALTSQLVQIFRAHFRGNVVLIHSRQTEAERHQIWERVLVADEPKVVIGPRSALFAPVRDLGLVIIDEAHESTYFQENPPRYSALRLASKMAQISGAEVILGSATPKVEDYYLAKKCGSLVTLAEKAKKSAEKVEITVVDLKDKQNFTKSRYFSDQLLDEITKNLESGWQTLIFHNRRGSAPLTLCEHCGWQALCKNCFLPLTLHADKGVLYCHTCGATEEIPFTCPECKNPDIIHKGFGTKLLEQEIKKRFPKARVARFDADNTKEETLNENYDEVKAGKIDIVIGTQVLAKGLDLPNLKTVGVVQADAGLALPDFAAEERTFALLTQVLGRIGRGHQERSAAIIQTFQPDSTTVKAAIAQDYVTFYNETLKVRRKAGFPPYCHLLRIAVTYKTEAATLKHIREIYKALVKNPRITVLQPTPAFHERTGRGFTWQLVVKATSRAELVKVAGDLPTIAGMHITLDPPSLL